MARFGALGKFASKARSVIPRGFPRRSTLRKRSSTGQPGSTRKGLDADNKKQMKDAVNTRVIEEKDIKVVDDVKNGNITAETAAKNLSPTAKKSVDDFKSELDKTTGQSDAGSKFKKQAELKKKKKEIDDAPGSPSTKAKRKKEIDDELEKVDADIKKMKSKRNKLIGRSFGALLVAGTTAQILSQLAEYAEENSGCFKFEYTGSGEIQKEKVMCAPDTGSPNETYGEDLCYCSKFNTRGIGASDSDNCRKITNESGNKFTPDNTAYSGNMACTPPDGNISLAENGFVYYEYQEMTILGAMADIAENAAESVWSGANSIFDNIKKFGYYFIIGFVSLILLTIAWKFISPLISK